MGKWKRKMEQEIKELREYINYLNIRIIYDLTILEYMKRSLEDRFGYSF